MTDNSGNTRYIDLPPDFIPPEMIKDSRTRSALLRHIEQLWDAGALGPEKELHVIGPGTESGYAVVLHIVPDDDDATNYMFPWNMWRDSRNPGDVEQ